MTKHLSHIGKQLMIFALIASVFNIYALEIWCGLTMENHSQHNIVEYHLASDHTPAGKENCPHQGNSKSDKKSCEDHHNLFLSAASNSGLKKLFLEAGDNKFIRPDHYTFIAARPFSQVTQPVKLFPDVGLKPKVSDIRIFICSLNI